MRRAILALVLIGCASILSTHPLAAAAAKPSEPISTKNPMKGCTAVGGYRGGNFTIRYEKVMVVAITPQGSDYWVFYPNDMSRHRTREKGVVKALALPTTEFIKDGERKQVYFTEHKMVLCTCPPFFWRSLPPQEVSAEYSAERH